MRVGSTSGVLGVVASLFFADVLGAQQDTARLRRTSSERIISISKGEVVTGGPTIRVDTVFVHRVDTVRTIVTRVDTAAVLAPPAAILPKVQRPIFWGAYSGTTWPWGNIDRVYTNGFHAGGVLGWESPNNPIGLRLDGAMSQLGREQGFNPINSGSGTALNLHFAADLKAKMLMLSGWSLYAIAGGNYHHYKRIALAANGTTLDQNNCDFMVRNACYQNASSESWSDKFGFNFGSGLDFHMGSQDMFLEARYFALQANGARSWTLPISLGVRYF